MTASLLIKSQRDCSNHRQPYTLQLKHHFASDGRALRKCTLCSGAFHMCATGEQDGGHTRNCWRHFRRPVHGRSAHIVCRYFLRLFLLFFQISSYGCLRVLVKVAATTEELAQALLEVRQQLAEAPRMTMEAQRAGSQSTAASSGQVDACDEQVSDLLRARHQME